MKKQSFTLDQAADIQKITGVPCTKVIDAFKGMQCSYERFRHFCLNQGALPSHNQQLVLNEQEMNGQLYDYPTQKMIDAYYKESVHNFAFQP